MAILHTTAVKQQKSAIEGIIKTETYVKSAAMSSLTANPYNPYYGVSTPTNPYNYSAADGQKNNAFSVLGATNFKHQAANPTKSHYAKVRVFTFTAITK